MENKSLFQRLVIFTIEGYLDDINATETYNYPFMLRVRTAVRGYMTFHRFDKEEYEKVIALGEHEFMKKLQEREVDRTIYALELLYLYITEIPKGERANLNISDAKIKSAKSNLIMDMLKLRNKSAESHARVKEIIEDSRLAAKMYFAYCEKELK